MSENKDFEVLDPQFTFWLATVEVSTEEDGKIKKVKEVHLVDAASPTDVEKKVTETMDGTMWEWTITECKKSKINCVY